VFDYAELRRHYEAIGYGGEILEALVSVAVVLDKYDLTDRQKDIVCNLLSEAGRETLKALPQKVYQGEWEPFNYGNVKLGDYVRVRPGTYDSDTGSLHNGLVGKLAHMAGRRCQVEYLGEASGRSIRHPMESLDSLKIK
jgi:hypothetical protein